MIEGERMPDATAFSIHLGVYRHRKDVQSVMHTHPKYSTTLAALEVKGVRNNDNNNKNNDKINIK